MLADIQFVLYVSSDADLDLLANCASSTLTFARFLRLARFMRIVRLMRFVTSTDEQSLMQHVAALLLTLAGLVLISACTFMWAEGLGPGGEQLQFHVVLY